MGKKQKSFKFKLIKSPPLPFTKLARQLGVADKEIAEMKRLAKLIKGE
jgi:hypothetical protein